LVRRRRQNELSLFTGLVMRIENNDAPAPLPDTAGGAGDGLRIALILLGATIALPAFVMGATLNAAMGTRGAIVASIVGGFVLACIAAAAAVVGAHSRLSSYQLILSAFGARGGKWVNGCLSVVMVGWFAGGGP